MAFIHSIVQTVEKYIKVHALLDKGKLYLVALSGGADSVALLRILCCLGYRVEAVHCNFHLRGAESNRDEQFVRALCETWKVPLHIAHFDTREYASLHKISIEMAARNLRYAYFEQLRNDVEAEGICVAHHREDSVETVLINLIRGTGLHGLCGIHSIHDNVVRPMLCVSRQDIESYLLAIGQDYVTDSSNLEDNVVRNKIRLNVMPLLRAINPSVDACICHTAERMTEVSKVFDATMNVAEKRVVRMKGELVVMDINELVRQPSPEYLLFVILKKYGFSPQQIEAVYANLSASTGKVYSSDDYDLIFDRGHILIGKRPKGISSMKIPEEGIYNCHPLDKRLRIEWKERNGDFQVSRVNSIATIDGDAVRFPLTLRTCQLGDRFIPLGMKGSKLISDYLTDRKKNIFEKRQQLVIVDNRGVVLWLVNERIDNRVRITDATSKVLVLSLE